MTSRFCFSLAGAAALMMAAAHGAPALIFHAPFDGTAVAAVAKGTAAPQIARGLSFEPGVDGQAVRLTAAAKSVLQYALKGNVRPEKGTVSLWARRDGSPAAPGAKEAWRRLFSFPEPCERFGSGALSLWWWGDRLRADLTDFGHTHLVRDGVPPPDGRWEHLAFTWDEAAKHARLYRNGVPCGPARADGHSEVAAVLRLAAERRKDSARGRIPFLFDRKDFTRFFVGCLGDRQQVDGLIDDVRVYDGALDDAGIRALFAAHADRAAPSPEKPDYAKLFAGDGPNPYVGGDRLDLALRAEYRFDAASVAKWQAEKRFRSVGALRFGALGGVPYVEAGARRDDRFAFFFDVDPAVKLYCLEFDYPDDATRTCDLIVQFREPHSDDYALQVGYFTGDEYPNTGRTLTHRCLYWTTPGRGALAAVALTARADVPAALSALRVYEVKNARLPALEVNAPKPADGWRRSFGSWWEDPSIGCDFATGGHGAHQISDLIDRTVAYMKYCGQDLLSYPGAWYHGLIDAAGYNPRAHAPDFLAAWYVKFDKAGLSLVPNVNPNTMPLPPGVVTAEAVTNGALHATPVAILDTGLPNTYGFHNSPPNFNFHHPETRAYLEGLVDALVEQGASHPSFKGVCLHLTMLSLCWFGDIRSGYNDYTVEAFARETGVKVPLDKTDPLRGRAVAKWIRAHAYEPWVQWRCDRVTAFYARLAAKLRARRGDLKLWLNCYVQPDMKQPDFMEDGFMTRQAREGGLDRAALAAIPNLVLCQSQFPAFCRKRERSLFPSDAAYQFNRVLQTRPGFFALTRGARFPWLNQFDLYWENPVGRAKGNPLNGDGFAEMGWRVTTLNPSGRHALREFVLPLRFDDVLGVSKGGYLVGTYGMEDDLRQFAAAFRALPAVRMAETAREGNVVARQADFDGRSYFYVANTGGEAATLDLRVPPGTHDLVSGAAVQGGLATLAPYELRAFAAPRGAPALAPLARATATPPLWPGNGLNEGRLVAFPEQLPRQRSTLGARPRCGSYNNVELAIPGVVTTRDTALGDFMKTLRGTIDEGRQLVFVDGRKLACNLNWIRDHVHIMKAQRHWGYDLTSFLDFILDTQRADGQFYELVKQLDDRHWSFVPSDCVRFYPPDYMALVRLEIEADVEYLVVEGATYRYKATGDDAWLARALPRLEKAIDYMTSDPKRWDAAHGLVKRGYTIDTWDFTFDPASSTNRVLTPATPQAIMHGDNSGVYQAMAQLAWLNGRLGRTAKAAAWRARADALKAAMYKHLWNGRFFFHQLPLNVPPVDAHERERLSLSAAYDMNRGLMPVADCRKTIEEYRARRRTTDCFAEWFTVDPPYTPAFGCHPKGEYVNGAVCPFTAGELAKAAFENGYEAYGWDILVRMKEMAARDGGVYFLYGAQDRKPQGRGPSAWGAASLLSAVDEGLAGIVDAGVTYDAIRFSPRWPVTDYTQVRYFTGYEVSGAVVDCQYVLRANGLRYLLRSPARRVAAHLLLPQGKTARALRVNGEARAFTVSRIGDSAYVDAVVEDLSGVCDLEVLF